MNDIDPFEDPKLLVDGAKESLLDFETACDAFVKTCKHEIVTYIDNKTGEKVFKARILQRIPGNVKHLSYRILNDLRNALDQAVCCGALFLGRADSKNVYFPFGKSLDDFSKAIKNRCLKVHHGLIAHLEAFNPHFEGDRELWALNAMSGPNKHQKLLGLGSNIQQMGIKAPSVFVGSTSFCTSKWSYLKNEIELGRTERGGHSQVNLSLALEIVIYDAEVFAGKPAIDVFRDLTAKVERIVLSVEAETYRLAEIT